MIWAMQHTPNAEHTLNATQVAAGLGVSMETVRRWRHSGRLVGHRVGREIRYPLSGVGAILQQRASGGHTR